MLTTGSRPSAIVRFRTMAIRARLQPIYQVVALRPRGTVLRSKLLTSSRAVPPPCGASRAPIKGPRDGRRVVAIGTASTGRVGPSRQVQHRVHLKRHRDIRLRVICAATSVLIRAFSSVQSTAALGRGVPARGEPVSRAAAWAARSSTCPRERAQGHHIVGQPRHPKKQAELVCWRARCGRRLVGARPVSGGGTGSSVDTIRSLTASPLRFTCQGRRKDETARRAYAPSLSQT